VALEIDRGDSASRDSARASRATLGVQAIRSPATEPREVPMRSRLGRFVVIGRCRRPRTGRPAARRREPSPGRRRWRSAWPRRWRRSLAPRRQGARKAHPQTDRVAYVSNGHPITGRKYAATLGQYYDSLQTSTSNGDKWEVFPIGDKAAVFTGWATARTVDPKGHADAGRAIFTMVFADDWHRLEARDRSEVAVGKCRR